jgi:DNA-binding NarL/FixJ family response regulator
MYLLLANRHEQECKALRLLFEQDPEVELAGEAAEAGGLLAQARAVRPDMVLLDWELPGLQASDMLQALRCLGHPLKVVAFSSRREARQEAVEAGVDAFVSREEPVEELLKTVRALAELSPCFAGF